MKKQNRTSRVNVEARMEKQSALFAIIEDMVADIISMPNSELKESLISKTGNLLNEIYDDRSVRAKYIEAFFKTLNHGSKPADSSWITRPVSLDDRVIDRPLYERYPSHFSTEEHNLHSYGKYPYPAYDQTTQQGLERRLCIMKRQIDGVSFALSEVIEQVAAGLVARNTHSRSDNKYHQSE